MKKSMKVICSMLIIFLFACEKDHSELIQNNHAGLLYQVKFDSESFYEFTYNDLNQLVEEKSKWHYTRHNYQNGQLISSDYYYDPGMASSSYQVAMASMNRKEWVNPTNTEKSITNTYSHDKKGNIIQSENDQVICKYSYDEQNRINRQTFYSDNKCNGYNHYTYDDKDNLIKSLDYWILANGEPTLRTTTEYEFDNKHNPYKKLGSFMLPGRSTNSNNIIKETYTLHFEVDKFTDKVQITENSYTYNSEGYPISKNDSEFYIYY